nr:nuclear transport factor 2-like [Nicotiana tomentosiformis]
MAMETTAPHSAPTAQVIENAFVEQYYQIQHHTPELVYRFYQDSSFLSRPDSNGLITSVTTMKGVEGIREDEVVKVTNKEEGEVA